MSAPWDNTWNLVDNGKRKVTKKAAYYTLGCKLNFSETSTFGKMLEDMGVITAKKGEAYKEKQNEREKLRGTFQVLWHNPQNQSFRYWSICQFGLAAFSFYRDYVSFFLGYLLEF